MNILNMSFERGFFVIFALFINLITCQVLVPGSCPDHSVVQNFSVASYTGNWYEIEKTQTTFESNGICVEANYSDFGNGSVRVLNSLIDSQTGETRSALGSARLEDPSRYEAKLLVNFPEMGDKEGPYWVLDTDYSSYSIVWSCRPAQDNLHSLQTVWFLSRTRNATEFLHGYVHGYLTGLKFDVNNLEETVQVNCSDTANLID